MADNDFMIEMNGQKVSLDKVINEYWGEIFPIDHTKPFKEQHEILKKKMTEKYGKEIIDKFYIMAEKFSNGSYNDKQEFIEYAYETGVYKEISPTYASDGREILKALIAKLYRNAPSVILDAGCGDLQISLGLALYLPKKDIQIYGIDNSKAAIKRAKENINQLQKENKINGQISVDYADYTANQSIELMTRKYNDVDTMLMCRPSTTVDAQEFIARMRKYGTRVIGCFADIIDKGWSLDDYAYMLNDQINYGLYYTRFSPTDIKEVNSSVILIGEFY